MADRVLTEIEVDETEALFLSLPSINHKIDAIFPSHRLLQRRVEKLEGLLKHVTGDVPR